MKDTAYYVECLMENDEQWEDYYRESFILGVFQELKDAEEAVKTIDVDRLIRHPVKDSKLKSDKLKTDSECWTVRTIEASDGWVIWTYTICITEVMTNTIYYRETP